MGEEPQELTPEIREWLKANWHYTDEEIDSLTAKQRRWFLALRDPKVIELLRKGRMIAEVVESRNCFIGLKPGDRYVFTTGGFLVPEESPRRPCLWAMAPMVPFTYTFYEFMLRGEEPKLQYDRVRCLDVGLECGGSGEVLFKIYYQERAS